MKLSYSLVRIATTVEGKLSVTISEGLRVKTYFPGRASAERLNKLLTDKVPCTVFIDKFGPTVFYEV
jgi:hypothetical protein